MAVIQTTSAAPAALMGKAANFLICPSHTKTQLSFVASADSDLETDPGSAGEDAPVADSDAYDGSDESGERACRAAAHTHTAWQNGYFYITDKPNLSSPENVCEASLEWHGRPRPLQRLEDFGAR